MRKIAVTLSVMAALALPAFGAEDETADAAPTDDIAVPAGALAEAAPVMSEPARPSVEVSGGGAVRGIPGITFERANPAVMFAGVVNNAATTQIFRFANAGRVAGTVTAKLYDAAGASLGTWTSASVPAGGAIEVTAVQIAAAATPALTAAQQAAPLSFAVSATFRGSAQQLSKTASVIVNQSSCFGGYGLGYVEGPGFSGATGAVRLVNGGSAAGTVTLSLRNAATGTELGKYTSASIPAKGFAVVTTATMAAAATPVVPASTAALAVVPTAATARIGIEHLATVAGSATASNLSAACGI